MLPNKFFPKTLGAVLGALLLSASSCGEAGTKEQDIADPKAQAIREAERLSEGSPRIKSPGRTIDATGKVPEELASLPDTAFVRLSDYSQEFSFDLRYATENNFMKTRVYDCPKCYTRAITARALIAANTEFAKYGLRIRFFDCYRPNSVQHIMWKVVPNPQYVANPDRGSIHNRGGAVDITLENFAGEPLDMGTDFDYFGRPAYHDTADLPSEVLSNRKLLKETMEHFGFWSVRTEWWHYNLKSASAYPVANFKWPCDP